MKGDRDANIMFSPCDGCDGYRILLGGWDNYQSFIREEGLESNEEATLVVVSSITLSIILFTSWFDRLPVYWAQKNLEDFTFLSEYMQDLSRYRSLMQRKRWSWKELGIAQPYLGLGQFRLWPSLDTRRIRCFSNFKVAKTDVGGLREDLPIQTYLYYIGIVIGTI